MILNLNPKNFNNDEVKEAQEKPNSCQTNNFVPPKFPVLIPLGTSVNHHCPSRISINPQAISFLNRDLNSGLCCDCGNGRDVVEAYYYGLSLAGRGYHGSIFLNR